MQGKSAGAARKAAAQIADEACMPAGIRSLCRNPPNVARAMRPIWRHCSVQEDLVIDDQRRMTLTISWATPSTSARTTSARKASSSDAASSVRRSSRDRVLRGDAPFVQDQDLGADLLDHLEDVRAVDDDPPLCRETPHEAAEDERASDVESGTRLVEHDHCRIVEERRRDEHLLTHAFRVGRHRRVAVAVEIEDREQRVDPAIDRLGRQASQPGAQREVFAAAHPGVEVRLFGNVSESSFVGDEILVDVVARRAGRRRRRGRGDP